ncbi:MAG: AAA family ATPase, partial [Patescibacteria group bacterium]
NKTVGKEYERSGPKVKFDDVAGIDEAKEELREIVNFIKNPEHFGRLGASIPRGALLIGPTGVGKTLSARAVAGEAGVPFLSINGSDFVEKFVGVGASRVRDFFAAGKKCGKCVLFIDELDAVGGQRSSVQIGGEREYAQTLDAILVEMDGFDKEQGIVVLAATNRPDILDEALLRPGRFTRRIVVDKPDVAGREETFDVHIRLKSVPIAPDVDLNDLARGTPGMVGADIENMVNEAAIIAARDPEQKDVTRQDFWEAKDKILLGLRRTSKVCSPRSLEISANHEAGHALLSVLLQDAEPVEKVTIISRGFTGGALYNLPFDDVRVKLEERAWADMVVAMGGRIAEELFLNIRTSGAENDLEIANNLARKMVRRWGMSSLGPISDPREKTDLQKGRSFGSGDGFSQALLAQVEAEEKRLISEAENTARRLLSDNDNRELHQEIVKQLLERETLSSEDIKKIVGDEVNSIVLPLQKEPS